MALTCHLGILLYASWLIFHVFCIYIIFQVQDDFLDCFGDSSVTGKVGTDIGEGKCTWLSVVALQRASPSQRLLMEEHYGRPEQESVDKVKALYRVSYLYVKLNLWYFYSSRNAARTSSVGMKYSHNTCSVLCKVQLVSKLIMVMSIFDPFIQV